MRFQRLAVLSATALMFISGCSAGRSLTSSSGTGGKGVSTGHDAYENNPPAVDYRAYEPAPVPPAMGISFSRTIGVSKSAGCGQAPCVHEPGCVAPSKCVGPTECVQEGSCTADSCGEGGFFKRLKCWPRRKATCAFPPVACVPEAPCVQEYAEPLCGATVCAEPCCEAPCVHDPCGETPGCSDNACCGEGCQHRSCLSKLLNGKLFGWRKQGLFCAARKGCTDGACGADPGCGQVAVTAGAPAQGAQHAAPSPSDHSHSAKSEGITSDPFAPAAPATQDAPPPPPAVPAAPANVPPAVPEAPAAPVAPAAPAAEQTLVEPLLWPRLNTVTEPTMVVQPRDFSTQSIGWQGI